MKSEQKTEKIKFKKPKSLTIMLWRNYTLFSLLIILIVGVFCYAVIGLTFINNTRAKMRNVCSELSGLLSDSGTDVELLTEYINGQSFFDGVNIVVVTSAGDIMLPADISKIELGYWSGVETAVQDKLAETESSEIMFRYETSYVYAMETDYGAAEGETSYIVISYAIGVASDVLSTILRYLIIIGIFIIIIAFLVSYGMAQKVADPLKRLANTATKMGKGDFNVRFASTEYQEIAQLSDTLNYAKDEIKKTDDFQKELLANVTHDLKTPLTMVKAYASMIQEISGDDPEKRNQHLQVIIDESDRLTGLVNDLLNVSKIRANVDQINKKVFNLTEFLFGILRKFEYLQDTQGYNFYADIDANLYTFADEEKIGQVLYNLISNAVNYTGQDKKVYIYLKLDVADNMIKFCVRDTGKGIKKEEIPSIWDRYYRAKEEHSRPVKGTGLGLSIVKTILEKHSFKFGVESEVGKGSTFWVDFPVVVADVPTE